MKILRSKFGQNMGYLWVSVQVHQVKKCGHWVRAMLMGVLPALRPRSFNNVSAPQAKNRQKNNQIKQAKKQKTKNKTTKTTNQTKNNQTNTHRNNTTCRPIAEYLFSMSTILVLFAFGFYFLLLLFENSFYPYHI